MLSGVLSFFYGHWRQIPMTLRNENRGQVAADILKIQTTIIIDTMKETQETTGCCPVICIKNCHDMQFYDVSGNLSLIHILKVLS